jgi:hypothetical protein
VVSEGLVGVRGDTDDIEDTGERDGVPGGESEPEGEHSRVEGDDGPLVCASLPTFRKEKSIRNSSRESSIIATVISEVYFDAIHCP